MAIKLERKLKFSRLVAVTMGTPLASSVFLSIILMVIVAGNLLNLVVAIVLASILIILVSFSYGELVSVYPSAAGTRVFLKKPLGDVLSLSFSLMWVFIILGAAGVEAYMVGNVLHFIFRSVSPLIWAVVVLTIILIINILGVEISGNFQMIITYFVAGSLIIISLISIFFIKSSYSAGVGNFDLGASLTATAIAVYFFLGFARVTTLGEEAIDYKRGIPRAMPVALIVVALTFILTAIAIFERVPFSVLEHTVIPQILLGNYMLVGTSVSIFIAIVSVIMSFSAFNAGILGTSRLIYALGREKTMPSFLGVIHTRFFTPYAALIFLYIIVIALVMLIFYTGNYAIPVLVAAGFDSFMYAFVSYSALWHHRKLKKEEIPFRVGGGYGMFIVPMIAFTILGILLLLSSPIEVTLFVVFGSLILIIIYSGILKKRI